MAQEINSGGSPVAFVGTINDGTGEVITVAAAATPQAVKSATLFLEAGNTSGGGLPFDGTTGKVTVAKAHAFGKYLVEVITGDIIGTNSAVLDVEVWAKQAGATLAQAGTGSRKSELATAARNSIGPAFAVVNLSAIGDTVEAQLRVGTNGHAGTFRDFALKMVKIGEAG